MNKSEASHGWIGLAWVLRRGNGDGRNQREMVKISESNSSGNPTVVKLEGELMGPWVPEVASYCERLLRQGLRLILEVGEVRFLDHNGLLLLQDLQERGVDLSNCTPFIVELMKSGGSFRSE